MSLPEHMPSQRATRPIRNADPSHLPAVSSQPAELPVGSMLGAYRLTRCLGRGGMGDVHAATHAQTSREVVVKVLSPDMVVNDEAVVRFRQEAAVMARIRHPNVVRLLDFNFMTDGRPYLVMEYLPGENLGEILSTRSFSVPQVSAIINQVAAALDAAHQLGVVHRDLKPENIMVVPRAGQSDLIKVIDFGICKARRFNHLTSKGTVMGTPEFMSPEQAQGRHEEVEAPSDQFALAVIAYLMLAGHMPWRASTPEEILHCVINNYPLALTDDGKYGAVQAVLFRAMAKAPEERYRSILAFSRAFDLALVQSGLLPAPCAEDEPPPRRLPASSVRRLEAHDEVVAQGLEILTRPRRRATQVGRAAVAAALILGGYFAATDRAVIRERAQQGLTALQLFVHGPAARRAVDGERLISRASQNAKAYLSMGTSP
jgi:eukaryotic-like serine/threonine-protein kinase